VVRNRTDRSIRSGNRCGRVDWRVGWLLTDSKVIAPPVTVPSRPLRSPRQRNWRCPTARRQVLRKLRFFVIEKQPDFDCHRAEQTSIRAGVASAGVQRLSVRTVTPTTVRYNPRVVKRTNDKPAPRPVEDYALMRERGSAADWFSVEFLVYYDGSQIRSFAYVRRKDGVDIPDGKYDVREGLDERRRRRKKWNGKWEVKWRHRWSLSGQ